MDNILFLIAARGGSKGVPRKNIRRIGGIPLVAYKIITAQKCAHEGRIIVSTDDLEIAEISKLYNAEVPFVRPDYLASDIASSIDVVLHTIDWVEKNDSKIYKYLCLLEPSSPFATPIDLKKAIDLIIEKKADTVLSVREVDVAKCFINKLDNKGRMSKFYRSMANLSSIRRQDQKAEYTMNGCFYLARIEYLKLYRTFQAIKSYPYIMSNEQSIEIDSMTNLMFAEYCVEKNIIDISPWKNLVID